MYLAKNNIFGFKLFFEQFWKMTINLKLNQKLLNHINFIESLMLLKAI
jgi:hypothetical protein